MTGRESLPLKRLKLFQPLNRLTDDQLVLLANRAERRRHSPGQRVLERGVRDGLDYYLVGGAVELKSGDGRTNRIVADSDKALNAIARLQPRMYDVIAVEACEFLVIEQDILNQMLRSAPVLEADLDGMVDDRPDDSEEHRLLMEFYAELRSNQVSLPSVPDVAWKVRRAADREDTTAEEIASAVTADPSIAAKLVRACNSPLYRGFNDVRNVREAVVRLGTRTTRQLVTVFSMREVFKSKQPALQKSMDELWRHSRDVASLCWVLADNATRVNPEEALLAGLLHDIGAIPVLVHAEHHANLHQNPALLDHAVTELRPDVGAAILETWGFPATFVGAARHAEDWMHESNQDLPQLVDIVIVAQLHAMIGGSQNADLPRFEDVPAYRRLGGLELNASRSLKLLTEARARVDEVHRLLSIH
ncbi:HDOD domain-containing protein [Marinobacter caseinilyticus]|uniref:HDOD domain-containing protein n=1 Tax=Marinobacter caseinilyticus TaxID=2692195 RepID=UPI00140B7E08|nr:HDOD domain-containing protein [Marinobacter caseinilyticus]